MSGYKNMRDGAIWSKRKESIIERLILAAMIIGTCLIWNHTLFGF